MIVLRSTWRQCLLAFLSTILILPAPAQQLPRPVPGNVLARRAALIFSGTVLAVKHVAPATQNGIGTVRVTFRVEQGIRGVRTGQQLTIREWDGLWTSGERYRVGETLLLYLHPPSAELGLTSPLGGEQGRIAIPPGQAVSQQHPPTKQIPRDRTPTAPRRPPIPE